MQATEHGSGHCLIIQSPEQWTGRSMHQICEVHRQKCFDDNGDINLAMLQMRSTPVGAGLPSPATLLFNRPIRDLLPKMNRKANFNPG